MLNKSDELHTTPDPPPRCCLRKKSLTTSTKNMRDPTKTIPEGRTFSTTKFKHF
jgi:hypothetical protein